MKQEHNNATNLPSINFVGITINYDEEYIDESLKPLYVDTDYDTEYD